MKNQVRDLNGVPWQVGQLRRGEIPAIHDEADYIVTEVTNPGADHCDIMVKCQCNGRPGGHCANGNHWFVTYNKPSQVLDPKTKEPYPAGLPFTFKVTQRDIDHGVTRSCSKCPVARAVHRAGKRRWTVSLDQIGPDKGQNYWLPEKVISWIGKFDGGQKVEPITVTITERCPSW